MDPLRKDIVLHLLAALVAGGVIGIERSYHGRPAGFRTHTLVCLAASLLMLVTLYQSRWLPGPLGEAVRMDPTRMAQGIATGIGFLGAGVIFKEGLTVRGLTTAASIWITSAIGTLIGADLLNLRKIRGLGAPVASIGGAGTFDGIFLAGIIAVLLT
jgi:putative Mg2+ transporter-C (MgtC) family protein